ncbi:MAG: DegT/DnrJ/EryC1/StrS family aminotransferase [Candidatus Zambryskibacteria bacterium]|nr:DegT/DnrJ/EryC1/StrS family aminotransferase [Candidatus Zambryskibacteria bacterium]
MKIPFLKPNINQRDINNMIRSVKSGWLSRGKYTEKFEENLGKYLGVSPAPCFLYSATAALHLSLILAGIKEGDEVITTPLSWVSTSNVILYCGAKPIFVDVELDTGLLDLDKIEERITKKTKAIIVVHLYGQMVDMRKLKKIADKYKLKIIEDAAHALESSRDEIRPGQLSFSTCFSFHAAKNITCGQGGAIYCKDRNKSLLLMKDGIGKKNKNIGNDKRVMVDFGYKYDSTDFQAALLIDQLQRIDKSHAKRQKVMERYQKAFAGKIKFQKPIINSIHAGHMFIIWVKNRDHIRSELAKRGIETSIHYDPIHLEPYYKKLMKVKLPIAEKLGRETITLPTYDLSPKEQDYIIKNVLDVAKNEKN